jgi:hypothetical protein
MSSDHFMQLAENKYNRLLIVIFLLLVSIALPENYGIAKAIGFVLFLISMLSIVRQIKPSRQFMRFYTLLIFSNLLLLILYLLGLLNIHSFDYGQFVISSVLLIVTSLPIFLIQKEIFSTRKVTADTLKGGIAIYLLIGVAWAALYNVLYGFNFQAFNGILLLQHQADFLHFSFSTLTTVGYGDITPITSFARMAADLEAIVGIMYPAILIARLVSLYNIHSQECP